jgi:hypothetical protein
MSHTCPVCEMTSYHPEYCDNCDEQRDYLAYRKLRGDPLTKEELQLLDQLNRWTKARMPPREGLPDDVKASIEELLDR